MRKTRVIRALAIAAAVLSVPVTAAAQASRAGGTFLVGGTTSPVIYPDVAFDNVNQRYLVVSGNGFIEGQLLDANGARITAFTVNASRAIGGYAQNPRVAFSPHVNGTGGYLVTWHESVGQIAQVRGRLISSGGAPLGTDFIISTDASAPGTSSCWLMGAAIAYSTTSREFIVTWMGNYQSTQDIKYMRLDTAGNLLQATPRRIGVGSADWERDPAVAYDPTRNEFMIVYAGYWDAQGYGYVAATRIQTGTGLVLSGPIELARQGATYVPSVTYSNTLQQYIVAWYNTGSSGTAFYGVNTSGLGGTVRLMSSYYVSYDALDLDYNPVSGDSLLVTHGRDPQTWEDAAISIRSDGAPYDNGFILTQTAEVRPLRSNPAANEGNFNPRMTASTTTNRWLAVTSSNFAAIHAQFAVSGSSGGGGGTPPPPPPPTGSQPRMSVDVPGNGSSVAGVFAVGGWALDLAGATPCGVDAVHVWAYPTSGTGPQFLGSAGMGVARPDVRTAFGLGSNFSNCGYGLTGILQPGTYDIVVYAHSTVTGTFNNQQTRRITVTAPPTIPRMYVDAPAQNQTITQFFTVAGWAIDYGSYTGTGVDAIHVWAYPLSGASPIWVGVGNLGVSRPDVASAFGAARFGPSGYYLQGSLPPGEYNLVVFAHSAVANAFNNAFVIRIRVV